MFFTEYSQDSHRFTQDSHKIHTLFTHCSHRFAQIRKLFATICTIRVKKPQKFSACGGLYTYRGCIRTIIRKLFANVHRRVRTLFTHIHKLFTEFASVHHCEYAIPLLLHSPLSACHASVPRCDMLSRTLVPAERAWCSLKLKKSSPWCR